MSITTERQITWSIDDTELVSTRPEPGAEPVDHTDHIFQLVRTLRKVEADPEHWNQGSWAKGITYLKRDEEGAYVCDDPQGPPCGTAFCFAGWAATLNRARWADAQTLLWEEDDGNLGFDYGAHKIEVADRARRILGLTGAESNWLFAGNRTLDQLRQGVGEIIDRMLAEQFPPPLPPVKEYVVTVTTEMTVTRFARSEQEAETIVRRDYGYMDSDDEDDYRTITVKEAEPEPGTGPGTYRVTLSWPPASSLSPEVGEFVADSPEQAQQMLRDRGMWAEDQDESNERTWKVEKIADAEPTDKFWRVSATSINGDTTLYTVAPNATEAERKAMEDGGYFHDYDSDYERTWTTAEIDVDEYRANR